MPIACLITIEPMDLSTGNRVTIYACSANDRRVTGLNGVLWEPAVTQIPSLSVNLWNGDFQAAPDPGNATFAINMTVIKQSFPAADQYLWIGAPVKIWAEEIGTAWPWTQRFLGRVAGLTRRDQTLSITAKVETETFAKNVLTATYAGTGGIEGGSDVKGRVKPLVIGWAQNVEPVLIDAVNSVYQFSGYGAIEGVTTLYERASDFGASVGDFATYAALVAASIPAGRWGTCLASGLVRLGAPAYGVITGDVRGHRVGGTTPRLTGAVINALATIAGVSAGNLNTTSLTTLDSAVPFNVNLVLADQTKFIDIAVRMALACNYQAAISLLGQFFVTAVNPAAGATLTINAQGRASPQVITPPDELDVSLPYWKVTLGANRSWRVHSATEVILATPAEETAAAALLLAQERGRVWTTPTIPSVAESNVGDTWVAPDGTFYDRVNDGGILLGGFAVTLAGYRPQLAWTRSANQPVVAAATTALWSNIVGQPNAPANNATRDVVTYSAVAPSAPIDGDLWVDTSGTFAVFKLRTSGAWQTGANALTAYNALSGTPVALADINTTESTKLAGIEAAADVTSAITGPAAIVIDADYTGAVISSLPRTESYKFLRNGTDLTTSSTTWSVSVLRGVISASIGSATGVLSLNLSGGVLTDAMLRITATNGGRSRSFDVAVTKLLGSPPATGASGTAANSTFSATVASSTMVAVSPELTITIGSGGTANLTANYEFETGTSGSYGLVGRWYRWNGSAYVAIGIEVNNSSNAQYFPADGVSLPGSGQVNFTDTGLTVASSQKYRLYARGGDATARNVWGSVSAVGG